MDSAARVVDPNIEHALFESYPFARALSLMLTRNANQAEDLLVATLRAVRMAPPESSSPPAIMVALREKMVRIARAVRVKSVLLWPVRVFIESPPVPDLANAGVLKMLRHLRFEHRACIVLRSVHDLPESEIADVLGLSAQDVRSSIARVKDQDMRRKIRALSDELESSVVRPASLRARSPIKLRYFAAGVGLALCIAAAIGIVATVIPHRNARVHRAVCSQTAIPINSALSSPSCQR